MIADPLELIFCHAPKTAGQSITRALVDACRDLTKPKPYAWARWEQHWRAQQYRRYHPEKWEVYRKFMVCRNPFHRMLSFHRYNRQRMKIIGVLHNNAPEVCPEHFKQHLENAGANDLFSIPQARYAGRTQDGVEILRFERLQEDWEKCAFKLVDSKLPVRNHAPYRLDARAFYLEHEDVAELVRKKHGVDFDRFGYSDDPADMEEEKQPALSERIRPRVLGLNQRRSCCG